MFECLTVTHKIHLLLSLSGGLLASSLCTTSQGGRLPTEMLSLGFPCVPFVSKLRIPSTAIHRGHSGSLLVPLWVLFKCLVFLCFQIICAPPSFNPHFSKGITLGTTATFRKAGPLCRKREKTEMMYAKNDTRQLCVAK